MRSIRLFLILGPVLLWELLYYLQLINPLRFSHPAGALDALTNVEFLRGLALTLAAIAVTSVL